MNSKPAPGTSAPEITATVIGGPYPTTTTLNLSELRDKPVVLYFYPKDDTPGCTTQACGIRDEWMTMKKKAHVFGVSIDSIKKHERFIAKHSLPFPLISDEDRQLVNAFGVWVEKTLYGRKYMGTERSTFIIGTDGRIKAVLEKVSPKDHAEKVLAMLS